MQKRFLSQTPEFAAAVARPSAEAMCRAPWPCRVFMAAIDGYLSELRRMLEAPIYIGPGR